MSILDQTKKPHRGGNYKNFDWALGQSLYDSGATGAACRRAIRCSESAWHKAVHKGQIVLDPSRAIKRGVRPGEDGYDISGRRFGRILVLSQADSLGRGARWNCRCDCGREYVVPAVSIHSGNTRGCSCRVASVGSKSNRWKGHGEIGSAVWGQIEARATSRGLAFELTIEDAWALFEKQKGLCAISGVPIGFGKRSEKTASLDRRDSAKGYFLGNVQWTHKTINLMKGSLSDELFVKWASVVTEFNQRSKS